MLKVSMEKTIFRNDAYYAHTQLYVMICMQLITAPQY